MSAVDKKLSEEEVAVIRDALLLKRKSLARAADGYRGRAIGAAYEAEMAIVDAIVSKLPFVLEVSK